MDEIRQVSYYPHSFNQIIFDASTMSQPPLDYWIGRIVHFFSYGDFSVRLPAALFGVGTVILLTLTISQLTSFPVAVGTGFIAAFLPFNLYFSQEARPYSICIFFFLLSLYTLRALINAEKKKLLLTFLFFIVMTLFLYTRALVPLVVTTILLIILIGYILYGIYKNGLFADDCYVNSIFAITAIIIAVTVYIPCFQLILLQGGRYLSDSLNILSFSKLVNVLIHLDLRPIWKAYMVQCEPLGWPLLILTLAAPFLVCRAQSIKKLLLIKILIILLPAVCLLQLTIFQAKTAMPFRPPYPIYILPSVLIISSVSFHSLWNIAKRTKYLKPARGILLIISVSMLFLSVYSALIFKSFPKKPNWRHLSSYLSFSYNANHLLIFDSFKPYMHWEPTFFGFPRYYKGQSSLVSVKRLPFVLTKLPNSNLVPVVVLYEYQEFNLTPNSTYPFISVHYPEMKTIDYSKINDDPNLIIHNLYGFKVITLKNSSGSLVKDTYAILKILINFMPNNSTVIELHLAAAALSRKMGTDTWQFHLTRAKTLSRKKHPALSRAISTINAIGPS